MIGRIVSSLSLFIATVTAAGQIAQVIDATDFCVFLPPSTETNRNIADTEWNANAFCTGNTPLAVGAETLPDGFITSAHFVATDAYVQVTGTIDYTKANLNGSDEGGQYDIKAPTGSSCVGWSYYVNLIEPVSNTYCMRCCNDTVSCNRGISEKGCAHIIPGDYSGPTSVTTDVSSDGPIETPSSLDSAISETSSSLDSAISEASSFLDSAISETSSSLDSAISETSSSLDSAISETSSSLDSSISETSSSLDSSISETSSVIELSSSVVQSTPTGTSISVSSAPGVIVTEQSVSGSNSVQPLFFTMGLIILYSFI